MPEFDLIDHPIILRSPRRLTKESAWVEHIPFAMCLVDLVRPGLFVELGTHWGDSYCAFCQAIQELRLPTRCFAVDTWEGDEHSGRYGSEVLADLRRHHDDAYGSFSALIQDTFDGASLQFDDGSIDLLHIDGFHTYEAVSHDFGVWLPKMSPRGVVVFHDTNEKTREFGVWRFWAEIRQRFPTFEFAHGHGLGIAIVGPDEPPPLHRFREAMSRTPAVEQLFFELGRRLRLRAELMAESDRAAAERQYFEHGIAELRREIAIQQEALAEKDRGLGIQQEALAEKDRGLGIQQEALAEKDRALGIQQEALAEKDRALGRQQEVLAELRLGLERREARIAELSGRERDAERAEAALAASREEARRAHEDLEQLKARTGYRVLEGAARRLDQLAPWSTRRRQLILAGVRATKVAVTEGPVGVMKRLPQVGAWGPEILSVARRPQPVLPTPEQGRELSFNDEYQLWLRDHEPSPEELARQRHAARRFPYRPTVSIIVPVHNSRPDWLAAAIDSVRAQTYRHWELCLVDDASTDTGTRRTLNRYRVHPKMRVARLPVNGGIVAASNRALALATGEFIGFLDHDDELKPNALFEVVRLLNRAPQTDFIYTDEDKKDPDGRLVDPFFKPDWSPEYVLTTNYVTHFAVYRAALVRQLGGLRPGYDGSQDHDLALRVTEKTSEIAHIPLPLYTWRKVPGSASASADAKPWAYAAGARALRDALERRGLHGDVGAGLWKGSHRVRFRIEGDPSVGIIIPTRDRVDLLRTCIESIESRTTYRNYQLIVVDNDSTDPETIDYLSSIKGRVIEAPGPFNFSRMMNGAAAEARSDLLLFLNNDTEVVSPGWLEAMIEYAQQDPIGAVGARLLYPAGHPQHEGVIMGLGMGTAGNVDHGGYFSMGQSVLNCTAVTAACLMTRATVFWEVGGFDERLAVAFNDVDFCLRVREAGYRVVYTPYAELVHYESASRGSLHPPADEEFFRFRWGQPGELPDPYYNPNFDPMRPFRPRIKGQG
jgi:GT2 family glycosyltransferase